MSQLGLEHLCVSKISKCLNSLFLDPYFQYCKYSHASKLFAYLYILSKEIGSQINSIFGCLPIQTVWMQTRTEILTFCRSWSASKPLDTRIVFLKEFFEKNVSRRQQKHEKLPSMQEINMDDENKM